MPTNPLTAIWQRLDREPPLFFEEQLDPALGGARERVISLGLLRSGPQSGSAPCRDCGAGFVGRVEWLDRARTGRKAAYIRCPACGPVQVDPDSLRCWAVNPQSLLDCVRESGGFRGASTELVGGHLWHLGNATWLGRPREAYFARCVHDGNQAGVAAALATHPRAVLFFPTEAAAHKWSGATDNPVVALESVVSLTPDGLAFGTAVVEGRLEDAGYGEPKKKTPRMRAERAGNVERLEDEMVRHLREAKETLQALIDLGSPPALPPRPEQQELAKRCGLTEADVSRCLKDKRAKALQLYWAMALDPEAILKFSGPIGGGPS